MKVNKSIIDKLKAINERAERGYKGEAIVAKEMLEKQLKKYGLTIEDLYVEAKNEYELRYKTDIERRVINQVLASMGIQSFKWVTRGAPKKVVLIVETALMYAEVLNKYYFYLDLWHEELETLFLAFIHQHELFPTKDHLNHKMIGDKEEEEDEKVDIFKIARMMSGLSQKQFDNGIKKIG